MSKQPESPKVTKPYAPDQEEQIKQTRHTPVEENSAKTKNETQLQPAKPKAAQNTFFSPVVRDDEKSHEKTSPEVERRTTNNPQSAKPFNIQENMEKVSPSTSTLSNSKSHDREESASIEKEKGQEREETGSRVEGRGEMRSQEREESSSTEEGREESSSIEEGREESSSREEGKGTMISQDKEDSRRQLEAKNLPEQETLSSVTILIMNANGKTFRGAEERRTNAIQKVVTEHMPHIILFQEFVTSTTEEKKKSRKKNPIPEHYDYAGNKEASIVYDKNCLDVEVLEEESDLLSIQDSLKPNQDNGLRDLKLDFKPMSRMCICRITDKKRSGLEFICISWHGPSNATDGGKLDDWAKIHYFEYWMEFLIKIQEKYCLPILVGGDYNVPARWIEKRVKNPFMLRSYEEPSRRVKKGVIDYCIVTNDLELGNITCVDLNLDKTYSNAYEVLDHDPVVGILSLPVSDVTARVGAIGFGK